jgi:hypothetical protein
MKAHPLGDGRQSVEKSPPKPVTKITKNFKFKINVKTGIMLRFGSRSGRMKEHNQNRKSSRFKPQTRQTLRKFNFKVREPPRVRQRVGENN